MNTEEVQNQAVKNMIFLINALLEQKDPVDEIFSAASKLGRKAMLNINTSQERIQTILNLHKIGLQLVHLKYPDQLASIIQPILELVYRTYTDAQYQQMEKIKELSHDIIDFMEENVEKSAYLEIYNKVASQILQKRTQRKISKKIKVNDQQGLENKQKKRVAKY